MWNQGAVPEARMLRRIEDGLRHREGACAFATAGEALAVALLARPSHPMDDACEALCRSMAGAMLMAEPGASGNVPPETRVRFALSAAVLSVARPEMSVACDDAVAAWIGCGIGCCRRLRDPSVLAARALLHLWWDDAEQAAEAVDALLELEDQAYGGTLMDWVVARLQDHGAGREQACFSNLLLSLAHDVGSGEGAALAVVGALVVMERRGLRREQALLGLKELLGEPGAPSGQRLVC